MKRLVWCHLFVMLAGATVSASAEEQNPAPTWSASIGTDVWLSTGESVWRHEVPLGPGLAGGSRLRFKDVDAPVARLNADFAWRRLVLAVAGGWGDIDDGKLIDQDFVNGFDFSRTRSSVDDENLYFANANVGLRVVDWQSFEQQRGSLDLLVGYQWWREKYVAFGAIDELGLGPGIPSGTKVITEKWTWQSIRVGGRAWIPGSHGFGLRVSTFFLPWSSIEIEDIHHLRSDLKQNPSILLDATGGFGWQVEGAITYTFWRALGAELGYRHWNVEMDEGDVKFRAVATSVPTLELKEASTERSGVFFGLFYRF